MSKSKFELSLDALKKLSLFVLNSLADQPKEWIAVGKAYQELHGFGDDPIFNQVFVRLFTVMRDEMWVGSPQEGPKFTVGLTFKGQTVIRHEAEIDLIYERHFHSWAKTIETAARKQRDFEQKRPAKEGKGQRSPKNGGSKILWRTDVDKGQTVLRQKEEMLLLVKNSINLPRDLKRLPDSDLQEVREYFSFRKQNKGKKRVFSKKVVRAVDKEISRRQETLQRRREDARVEMEMDKLKSSGSSIRSSLPNKDNALLLRLWQANLKRADASTGEKKDEHLSIVSAVEKEWRRRVRDLPEVEAFKWPTTDVGSGHGGGDFERAEESFLKVLGYTVGKTNGLPASTRQLILDRCFSGQLPPVEGISALRMWGEPKSALRLRKIAYHIAGLAKNFKKMQSRGYEDAISDWEDDLKYMHDKYYVRHFGFSWPGRGL